jgi:hypothetical protein
MASPRRLAAILAADVAGYSRLMGADEEGNTGRPTPVKSMTSSEWSGSFVRSRPTWATMPG